MPSVAAYLRERVAELSRRAARGEDPQRVAGLYRAGVDRDDQPLDVGPVTTNTGQVELPAGGLVQRPVVGALVDPP